MRRFASSDVIGERLRWLGILVQVEQSETPGSIGGTETDPARLRPSDIPAAVGDAGYARRLLDWTPRVAWETT